VNIQGDEHGVEIYSMLEEYETGKENNLLE
jgi:hypothetical protein